MTTIEGPATRSRVRDAGGEKDLLRPVWSLRSPGAKSARRPRAPLMATAQRHSNAFLDQGDGITGQPDDEEDKLKEALRRSASGRPNDTSTPLESHAPQRPTTSAAAAAAAPPSPARRSRRVKAMTKSDEPPQRYDEESPFLDTKSSSRPIAKQKAQEARKRSNHVQDRSNSSSEEGETGAAVADTANSKSSDDQQVNAQPSTRAESGPRTSEQRLAELRSRIKQAAAGQSRDRVQSRALVDLTEADATSSEQQQGANHGLRRAATMTDSGEASKPLSRTRSHVSTSSARERLQERRRKREEEQALAIKSSGDHEASGPKEANSQASQTSLNRRHSTYHRSSRLTEDKEKPLGVDSTSQRASKWASTQTSQAILSSPGPQRGRFSHDDDDVENKSPEFDVSKPESTHEAIPSAAPPRQTSSALASLEASLAKLGSGKRLSNTTKSKRHSLGVTPTVVDNEMHLPGQTESRGESSETHAAVSSHKATDYVGPRMPAALRPTSTGRTDVQAASSQHTSLQKERADSTKRHQQRLLGNETGNDDAGNSPRKQPLVSLAQSRTSKSGKQFSLSGASKPSSMSSNSTFLERARAARAQPRAEVEEQRQHVQDEAMDRDQTERKAAQAALDLVNERLAQQERLRAIDKANRRKSMSVLSSTPVSTNQDDEDEDAEDEARVEREITPMSDVSPSPTSVKNTPTRSHESTQKPAKEVSAAAKLARRRSLYTYLPTSRSRVSGLDRGTPSHSREATPAIVETPVRRAAGTLSEPQTVIHEHVRRLSTHPEQVGRGKAKSTSNRFLRGAVVLVDARDLNGESVSDRWVTLLKEVGAKVTTRIPSSDSRRQITHLVWKNGRPSTLNYFKSLSDEMKPIVVGINWIIKCLQDEEWCHEEDHLVEFGREVIWSSLRRQTSAISPLQGQQNQFAIHPDSAWTTATFTASPTPMAPTTLSVNVNERSLTNTPLSKASSLAIGVGGTAHEFSPSEPSPLRNEFFRVHDAMRTC
ncbi:unnamed protein product [Sympodiomycopsis kandeliae]